MKFESESQQQCQLNLLNQRLECPNCQNRESCFCQEKDININQIMQEDMDWAINYLSPCLPFQAGISQHENKQVLKEKIIKKKTKQQPKRKKKKVVGIQYIINTSDDLIRVYQGLSITKEGIVRFAYSIGMLSFGFNPREITQVSYLKSNSLIQITRSQQPLPNMISLDEALRFLCCRPFNRMYQEASSALIEFCKFKDEVINSIQNLQLSESLINQKEEEMVLFEEKSLNYIKQYSDQHVNAIFSYSFGGINYRKKEIQMKNSGYSKSFLDLIGVDVENFNTIQLRHQKIDLVQDKYEIMQSSIFGLNQRFFNGQIIKMAYNIMTFDGFPLKIQTSREFCFPPNFEYKQLLEMPCEYLFQIITIDIELQELQKLIQYRERLLSDKKQLSFDEFIKKELSYLFENVEYSVHSQSFVQKYYKENIVNLHKFEQQKLLKQNKQNKNNEEIFFSNNLNSFWSNSKEIIINESD